MADLHCFDVQLAATFGVEEAIIIHRFQFWINKNREGRRNQREGRTWTYNTCQEIAAEFPYWTARKVRRLLESLVTQGVLICEKPNKTNGDVTNWYAFADEPRFIKTAQFEAAEPPSQPHSPNSANGLPKTANGVPFSANGLPNSANVYKDQLETQLKQDAGAQGEARHWLPGDAYLEALRLCRQAGGQVWEPILGLQWETRLEICAEVLEPYVRSGRSITPEILQSLVADARRFAASRHCRVTRQILAHSAANVMENLVITDDSGPIATLATPTAETTGEPLKPDPCQGRTPIPRTLEMQLVALVAYSASRGDWDGVERDLGEFRSLLPGCGLTDRRWLNQELERARNLGYAQAGVTRQ